MLKLLLLSVIAAAAAGKPCCPSRISGRLECKDMLADPAVLAQLDSAAGKLAKGSNALPVAKIQACQKALTCELPADCGKDISASVVSFKKCVKAIMAVPDPKKESVGAKGGAVREMVQATDAGDAAGKLGAAKKLGTGFVETTSLRRAQAQCSAKSTRCMQVIIGMTDSAPDAVRHATTKSVAECGAGLHRGTDNSKTEFNGVDQCCEEAFEVSANKRIVSMTSGLVTEGTAVSITCKRRSLSMDGLSIGGKVKQVGRKMEAFMKGYEKTCSCDVSVKDAIQTGARQIIGAFTSLFGN